MPGGIPCGERASAPGRCAPCTQNGSAVPTTASSTTNPRPWTPARHGPDGHAARVPGHDRAVPARPHPVGTSASRERGGAPPRACRSSRRRSTTPGDAPDLVIPDAPTAHRAGLGRVDQIGEEGGRVPSAMRRERGDWPLGGDVEGGEPAERRPGRRFDVSAQARRADATAVVPEARLSTKEDPVIERSAGGRRWLEHVGPVVLVDHVRLGLRGLAIHGADRWLGIIHPKRRRVRCGSQRVP